MDNYPRLKVVGVAAEFADGLGYLTTHASGPRLVAFLGSTIGNFTEEDIARFFTMLRRHLRPMDRLLLGVDLIKDPAVLEAAYDDAQGVTAKFNLNILARLNRELSANFDLATFRHRAVWNHERGRIEMNLVSVRNQRVRIGDLNLDIDFRRMKRSTQKTATSTPSREWNRCSRATDFRFLVTLAILGINFVFSWPLDHPATMVPISFS